MRSARKLKGTNIYLNDDLCAASQAIKNTQMQEYPGRAQGKMHIPGILSSSSKKPHIDGVSNREKTSQVSAQRMLATEWDPRSPQELVGRPWLLPFFPSNNLARPALKKCTPCLYPRLRTLAQGTT